MSDLVKNLDKIQEWQKKGVDPFVFLKIIQDIKTLINSHEGIYKEEILTFINKEFPFVIIPKQDISESKYNDNSDDDDSDDDDSDEDILWTNR